MTQQQSNLSKQEVEASLRTIDASQKEVNRAIKPDRKLTLAASIGYGASVFGFGFAGKFGITSPSALLALVGFCVFICLTGIIWNRQKQKGIKQRQLPRTLKETGLMILFSSSFGALYLGGFFLNEAGWGLAPYFCSIAAAVGIFVWMDRYPNFPFGTSTGTDEQ